MRKGGNNGRQEGERLKEERPKTEKTEEGG